MKTQSTLASVIPNKKAWIRGNYSLNAEDLYSPIDSPSSCKFCLSGGVQRISQDYFGKEHNILDEIVKEYTKENVKYSGKSMSHRGKDFWTIVGFNDSPITTWEDVQEVIARFDAQLKENV